MSAGHNWPGEAKGASTWPESSVTVRMARWSADHPWRASRALARRSWPPASASAAPSRASQPPMPTTGSATAGSPTQLDHDAGLAEARHRERPDHRRARAADSAAGAAGGRAAVRAGMSELPRGPNVGRSPVWSPKHHALLVHVTLRGSPDNRTSRRCRRHRAGAGATTPACGSKRSATPRSTTRSTTRSATTWRRPSDISLPVTLVILLHRVRRDRRRRRPGAARAVRGRCRDRAVAPLSHSCPDSGTSSSMILLMGMAVGVDYSLFYVKRAREERRRGTADARRGRDRRRDVRALGARLRRSRSSSRCWACSSPATSTFASLATGSIIVVAVAVLGSLTVLPAVLVKLGRVRRPAARAACCGG